MATLYTVLQATKAALRARLRTMQPNRDTTTGFHCRESAAVGSREIEDAIGRPRLFELGRSSYNRVTWISSSVRATEVSIPLTINYPDTEEWRDAAMDDFEKLSESLRDTSLGVTGLQLCVVDMDAGPEFVDAENDDWFSMVINLHAICEATG